MFEIPTKFNSFARFLKYRHNSRVLRDFWNTDQIYYFCEIFARFLKYRQNSLVLGDFEIPTKFTSFVPQTLSSENNLPCFQRTIYLAFKVQSTLSSENNLLCGVGFLSSSFWPGWPPGWPAGWSPVWLAWHVGLRAGLAGLMAGLAKGFWLGPAWPDRQNVVSSS